MMKERTDWRVERNGWTLGWPNCLRLLHDGTLETEEEVWRLNRKDARTLGRLLLAYAETGAVPMGDEEISE